MKVKIGNTIHDSRKEPVMIICTDAKRQQMAQMLAGATKYCQYPDLPEWTANDWVGIKMWMGELGESDSDTLAGTKTVEYDLTDPKNTEIVP